VSDASQEGSLNGTGSWASDSAERASTPPGLIAERPEIVVGAAFAGGLALAILLRRLGGRHDS
jgi:hypothetical protein